MDAVELVKAVGTVIAACAGLVAAAKSIQNGKRSEGRDENVEKLLELTSKLDGKVDGLNSRFDRHEAAINIQVGDLRTDMEDVKKQQHSHSNRLTTVEAELRSFTTPKRGRR